MAEQNESTTQREVNVEDDDFFGNQDDDEHVERQRQNREVEALRRPHFSTGLREGVTAAHDANLQGGFDAGFAAGAKAVPEAGFLYVLSPFALSPDTHSRSAMHTFVF